MDPEVADIIRQEKHRQVFQLHCLCILIYVNLSAVIQPYV
jgi:hypothetical protein